MALSFTQDTTVSTGKRGRQPIEIDPDIREAFAYAISAASWDTYYSAVVKTETAKGSKMRKAVVLAGCVKRDLTKLRKEYADAGNVYRLSVVETKVSDDEIKVSFRVYPATTD